jgi:hypothetical protein
MYLPVSNTAILFMGFPFGFFTQGIYASLGPYFTELFPTRIRASGQAFAYNFGRSIGAFFVTIVALLAETMPLGEAIAALSLGGYGLALIATLMLPETRGRDLTVMDELQVAAGQSAMRPDRLPSKSSHSASHAR